MGNIYDRMNENTGITIYRKDGSKKKVKNEAAKKLLDERAKKMAAKKNTDEIDEI